MEKVKHCDHCNVDCLHEIRKEIRGFKRTMINIVTLGFAEFLNSKIQRCLVCGHTEHLDIRKYKELDTTDT